MIQDFVTKEKRLNKKLQTNRLEATLITICVLFVAFYVFQAVRFITTPKIEENTTTVDLTNLKPLPEVNFNWTPINERTEQPKPLPYIKFNQLEK